MIDCIDGDFFESLADLTHGDIYSKQIAPSVDNINIIVNKLNKTPILFINTERILELLNVVKDYKKEVIIISHNSDITLNDAILNYIPSNVIRIWCQNYNGNPNDIIKALPIGLERNRWFPEEKKQDVLYEYSNKEINKEHLVYMNFNPNTNNIRKEWYEYFQNKDYVYSNMLGNGNNFKLYIEDVKKSKFVLSPTGNGIDCHRNWECLCVGSIPIIEKSNFTNEIFKDLPVMLVDTFKDITEENLNNFLNKKENNSITIDKITKDYWRKLILTDVR